MSLFFSKNEPTLSFVFDIRDTSISLAAVKFEFGKKPEIIICRNFEFEYPDPKFYKKYAPSMIKVLDEAVISVRKDLIKTGNRERINAHYFFIGSPWCVSQSKTIKIIKEKPFEINNDLLEKIFISEEFATEKSLEELTLEPNWKVLEEKIIQSKLNGYKVDDIFKKKTTNFAIELFVSYIPYEIKDKIASFVDEKIGKNILRQNNSCILSSYSFLRDLYLNKNNFIYVDVGKLITDVYVVRDDVIFEIASIPFGEENIIQTSLSRTNLSRSVFTSHINIGLENKFELVSHNNVEDLLRFGFDVWENKLLDSLSKICTEMNMPNNMFMIPNSVISKILTKTLLNREKDKKLKMLGSKIEMTIITEEILNNYILNGRTFMNEPYIKMDLVFLNKMLK